MLAGRGETRTERFSGPAYLAARDRATMTAMIRVLVSALMAALMAADAAGAKTKLVTLPRETIATLTPFLARGELALIESKVDGSLRQITVMTLVDAPPEVAYGVVAAPERYPEFVGSMAKSEVTRRQGRVAIVDWELEVPLNNLEGTNLFRFGENVIEIETISGDIPEGIWRWEIHPAPGGKSIVVEYAYSDIRRASWFMRQLIQRHRAAEHATVLSASTVFMKALKLRAEKLAGRGQGKRPDTRGRRVAELRSLTQGGSRLDVRALDPLLRRGYVSLVESFPDGRLRQASIVTYAYTSLSRAFGVAADPGRYQQFMSSVNRSQVLKKEGASIVYELEVEVPLFNLTFTSRAEKTAPWSIRTRSIGGDLEDARFGWDMEAVAPDRTRVMHYLNTDARNASWLLRRMIDREPYFEHGFNAACGLVMVRSVRGHAEGWN